MKDREVANIVNVAEKTIYNWRKNRKELIRIIEKGIESEKENKISINGHQNNIINGNTKNISIKNDSKSNEILEALEKLSEIKRKKFYHLIMAEVYKEEELK